MEQPCGDRPTVLSPRQKLDHLLGIPTKAEGKLGWKRNVSFKDLVHRMVDSDCK